MFSIGLDNIKNPHNLGSAVRAVACFGGNIVIYSGSRMKPGSSAVGHQGIIPIIPTADILSVIPRGHVPVAVELCEDSQSLVEYEHPEKAYYIFGAEDNTRKKSDRSMSRYYPDPLKILSKSSSLCECSFV